MTDKISTREATAALERSGYLLESRLESVLQKAGYYTEANCAYRDRETGKLRELDLFALSATKAGPGEHDYIFPVLLFECVNNPQPMALFTKAPQTSFLHHEHVRCSGLPVSLYVTKPARRWETLPWYLSMNEYHHYCRGRIATQFCSFRRKKEKNLDEWMAFHEESHMGVFKALSVALEYFVEEHYRRWHLATAEPVVLLKSVSPF